MAATAARVGRGTTLTEKSTGSHVAIAEMCRLVPYEMDFGSVEATHLTSDNNAREFIPAGFIDYGSVEFVANYSSTEADRMIDISEAQDTIEWKFTIPDNVGSPGTATIATFMGFIMKLKPVDEASADQSKPIQMLSTIKITGKVTFAEAT